MLFHLGLLLPLLVHGFLRYVEHSDIACMGGPCEHAPDTVWALEQGGQWKCLADLPEGLHVAQCTYDLHEERLLYELAGAATERVHKNDPMVLLVILVLLTTFCGSIGCIMEGCRTGCRTGAPRWR